MSKRIKDAPFLGVAIPTSNESVDREYWETDASVVDIATRLGFDSSKAVSKAVRPAILRGIVCVDCKKEAVCTGRGSAKSIIDSFASRKLYGRPFLCDPCEREERRRRLNGKGKHPPASSYYPDRHVRPPVVASVDAKKSFYESWEWRTLRMEVIKEHGRECQCCGNRPGMKYASGEPVRIVVDHIKPLSKYWHLRLDRTNLQILCDECNQGKGNWDETDFRAPEAPDEWVELPQDDIALTVLAELNGETIQ